MYTKWDWIFIVLVAIIVFSAIQGYFDHNVKKFFDIILNSKNVGFLFLLLFIGIFLYYIFKSNVVYCLDEETKKQLMEVSNNVIVNNPNINISNSMAKAFANAGTGVAIGGGMSAMAKIVKGSGLPLGTKIGATVVGGVLAGSAVVVFTAVNTISQNKIEKSSRLNNNGSNGFFSANCPLENNEVISNVDAVHNFLLANYILHIAVLYLLFAIAILYISDKIINNKWELLFIKKYFGIRFYNLIIKGISYTSKSNQIWIFLIWIMLIFSSICSIYFAYYLLNNIDVISKIVNESSSDILNVIPVIIYSKVVSSKEKILEENKRKSGVYKWTNIKNNKCYIGSANDLSKRLSYYFSTKYMLNYKNKSKIYSSILKYGLDSFKLEILEYCEKKRSPHKRTILFRSNKPLI